MNRHRTSVGLILWAGTFSTMAPVVAQPTAAEKTKQRTESGDKADALLREGKFAEAIEPATTCVRLSREIDGEKHWRTFDAEQRLKLAQTAKGFPEEKQKKLREAMAAEQQSLAMQNNKPVEALLHARKAREGYESVLDDDDLAVGRMWHQLGRIGSVTNDLKSARAANEAALRVWRKGLPKDHPSLGRTLLNMGIVCLRQGESREAEKYLKEAVQVLRVSLGTDDLLVAMALRGLGAVQTDLRDHLSAKMSYSEALAIDRKLLKPDDPNLARSLNNLGVVQSTLRENEPAKKSFTEALAIFHKALPPDHPELANCLISLGVAHFNLREYEPAKTCFTEVLTIYRKSLPPDHHDVAKCLFNLGNAHRDLGEVEAAKQIFTEALAIYRKTLKPDDLSIARSLNNLGNVQLQLREYEAAKKSHVEALAIRRQALPPDHPDVARSLDNLGYVQNALREDESAKKSFTEAIAIHRKLLDLAHPLLAASLNNLGIVQSNLREYEPARMSFVEAVAIRRKSLKPDHPELAQSLFNLGQAQRKLLDHEASRKSFTEALAIRRKSLKADDRNVALCLQGLGNAQASLGEYESARNSHAETLAIYRKILKPDDPELAHTLHNLGNVERTLGEYAAAKKRFTDTLSILRETLPPGHPDLAVTLVSLGIVHLDLREFDLAKTCFTAALAIHRKAQKPDGSDVATCLNNLANVQLHLREYDAAKQNFIEALKIYREALSPDHPDVARCLNGLGNVHRDLREFEAARKSLTDALAINRKALPPGHPGLAKNLTSLGNVQRQLREYEAAKKSHTEALAINRKAFPPTHPAIRMSLNSLANVHGGLGEFEAARERHTEALAICRKTLPPDHPDLAQSLSNLGYLELCTTGPSDQVRTHLADALAIKRNELAQLAGLQAEAEQLTSVAEARHTFGLYLSAHLPSELPSTYSAVLAFKGTVTARQRLTRQLRDDANPDVQRLLAQLQAINRDLVRLALANSPTEQPGKIEFPAQLQSRLMRERADLDRLTEQRKELERQLLARNPATRRLQDQLALTPAALAACLPAETCLIDVVEYVHVTPPPQGQRAPGGEYRLLAFVVQKGKQVQVVELGASTGVNARIGAWRASHGVGRLPAAGEPDPAIELRKTLWEPLQKHLDKDVKTVLISPDGPLHGLPFAALPGSKAGTYLLHEYAFAIVPVPILLPEMMEKKPGRPEAASLLLMGGIDFGEGKDTPSPKGSAKLPAVPRYLNLVGTDSEVDLRAQFEEAFPDTPAPKIFKKDRATKAAFLQNAASFGYVHLATHGFFAQESEKSALDPGSAELGLRDFQMDRVLVGRNPGLLSGIVFAGVNSPDRPKEDGVLTALEAGELDLSRTELVVLSACETGRGKVAGGEGVLGLQRAFQLAGARSVVASLWKVPDEETHQLMREFYRRLWDVKKPVSRVEALRQAQLWMLTNGKRSGLQPPEVKGPLPPHVWAAFVLSGDWR